MWENGMLAIILCKETEDHRARMCWELPTSAFKCEGTRIQDREVTCLNISTSFMADPVKP